MEEEKEYSRREPSRDKEESYGGDGKQGFRKQMKFKKKICRFTADPKLAETLNYKNIELLEKFITNRGKIMPRRVTGNSAKYQRILAKEIKKARSVGLLPFKVH